MSYDVSLALKVLKAKDGQHAARCGPQSGIMCHPNPLLSKIKIQEGNKEKEIKEQKGERRYYLCKILLCMTCWQTFLFIHTAKLKSQQTEKDNRGQSARKFKGENDDPLIQSKQM